MDCISWCLCFFILLREGLVHCLASRNLKTITPSGVTVRSQVSSTPLLNSIQHNKNLTVVWSISLQTWVASNALSSLMQDVVSTGSITPSKPNPLGTSTISSTRTVPGREGFCSHYAGSICRDVLYRSLPQYNNSKRYFDKKYGQNNTELFASILFKELKKFTKQEPNQKCDQLIQVSLCQYIFSPCLPNGQPVKYCREDCEELTKECELYLNRLIGAGATIKELKNIDFRHLDLPTNCNIYPSGKSNNKSCIYIGLFDHSSKDSSSTTDIFFWIIVGGPTFIVIITLVLGIICFKRLQNKARKEAKEKEAADGFVLDKLENETSTMRDRVQRRSEFPSLSSKIAELYDPNKLRHFSLDRIEYVSDLGEGQFGLVFKGIAEGLDDSKNSSFKTPVAVKTLKHDSNDYSKEDFNQEVALMSVLDHPNIVKLMAVAMEEDPYCMIFEFMDLGDLNQFLRRVKPLDDITESTDFQLCLEDFLSICSQVGCGMEYLACLHFVHRDLATRNCLVGEGIIVKIADFGLSRDIYSSDYYKVRGDAILPVRWMPPEALLHGRFTVESDVYSYGVLMWEVFTYALQPFYGYSNEEVLGFAKQGILLGQPDECPTHIYDLMCECWRRNPETRPRFSTIIKRLVTEPPPSTYSRPKSFSVTEGKSISQTAEIKQPLTSKIPTDNYQSPGAVINTGFVTGSPNGAVLSNSGNDDSAFVDQPST